MAILLLVVIYIVFISLGLPDGILGGAWPAIRDDLDQAVSIGGFIALTVTLATILSSLATSLLVRKLGIGLLLICSVALTAVALIGISQSPSIIWLFIFAIPLGLGAGAIDSALNNYVALHYKAHHMNWLHGFWGVGATAGPVIFAASFTATSDWHTGYFNLGIIQICIVIILLASLALWNKVHPRKMSEKNEGMAPKNESYMVLLQKNPVRYTFLAFSIYTGLEVAVGLWLASYLVSIQAVPAQTAALWTGIYFASITIGRLLTGFVSFKLNGTLLVRIGLLLSFIGIAILASTSLSIVGIILIGIGFAPIYPSLIHITPERFGKTQADKIMSLQMVGGYVGVAILPPVIGLISGIVSLYAFIILVPLSLALLVFSTEKLNRLTN